MVPLREAAYCACIALLGVLLYAHTWDGDFVLDDTPAVKRNPDVLAVTPLRAVFDHDFWGRPVASEASHKSYRPLTVLSYRAVSWACGVGPAPQRAANIALYAVACAAVYVLARRRGWLSAEGALAAGLVFAAHPMHVENVASLVGRADLLSMLAYMASVEAYADAARPGAPAVRRSVTFAGALVLAVVAYLCKETGLLALVVGAALDHIADGRLVGLVVLGPRRGGEGSWRGLAARTVIAAAVTVGCVAAGVVVRGYMTTPPHEWEDNPVPFEPSAYVRALWYSHMHAWYLLLLCVPVWSCSHWGTVIPAPATPLAALCAYTLFVGAVWASLRTRRARVGAAACVLTVVPFIPASGVLRVGTFIAERLLLLPSVGLAVAVGASVDAACGVEVLDEPNTVDAGNPVWTTVDSTPMEASRIDTAGSKMGLRKRRKGGGAALDTAVGGAEVGTKSAPAHKESPGRVRSVGVWGVVLLLLIGYAARTVPRAAAWKADLSLQEWDVRECARSSKSQLSLATLRTNAGEMEKATEILDELVTFYNASRVWYARGRVAQKQGHKQQALEHYQTALAKVRPGMQPPSALAAAIARLLCEKHPPSKACIAAVDLADRSFAAYRDRPKPDQQYLIARVWGAVDRLERRVSERTGRIFADLAEAAETSRKREAACSIHFENLLHLRYVRHEAPDAEAVYGISERVRRACAAVIAGDCWDSPQGADLIRYMKETCGVPV